MSTSRHEQAHESYERIIQVATRLFAEHGYHGVSTRTIAAEVGLNIATVSYHVGSKQKLYQEVFRRAFANEEALIARYIGHVADATVSDPAALSHLFAAMVGDLLALTLRHPETPRLWVRRWLEKEGDLENIETQFSIPIYRMIRALLERAAQAGAVKIHDLDLGLFLKSFTWMMYGYFLGGPLNWQTTAADPYAPEEIAKFSAYLIDYICRMLHLPAPLLIAVSEKERA